MKFKAIQFHVEPEPNAPEDPAQPPAEDPPAQEPATESEGCGK